MEAVHVRISPDPGFEESLKTLVLLILTFLSIIIRIYQIYRAWSIMRRYYQSLVDYLDEEEDAAEEAQDMEEEAQDMEEERLDRDHPNEVVQWSGGFRMRHFIENFDPVRPQALGDGTPEFYLWREYKRNLLRRQLEREARQRVRHARQELREQRLRA